MIVDLVVNIESISNNFRTLQKTILLEKILDILSNIENYLTYFTFINKY